MKTDKISRLKWYLRFFGLTETLLLRLENVAICNMFQFLVVLCNRNVGLYFGLTKFSDVVIRTRSPVLGLNTEYSYYKIRNNKYCNNNFFWNLLSLFNYDQRWCVQHTSIMLHKTYPMFYEYWIFVLFLLLPIFYS